MSDKTGIFPDMASTTSIGQFLGRGSFGSAEGGGDRMDLDDTDDSKWILKMLPLVGPVAFVFCF